MYVRLTWEACFNVHAKTRVVQICQVRRQVHPADVFDGGLFVIKLGRAKMLQTWKSSCDSPGIRKMTNSAWFRKSTFFFEDVFSDVRRKVSVFYLAEDEYTKSLCFLAMTWPWWKKWVQHGSTWLFLLSLKKQVSPGGLPIDETGNDLQLTSSPHRILVFTRSDQRILTMEYFIDNISSGSVEEVLVTIPPQKCPYSV